MGIYLRASAARQPQYDLLPAPNGMNENNKSKKNIFTYLFFALACCTPTVEQINLHSDCFVPSYPQVYVTRYLGVVYIMARLWVGLRLYDWTSDLALDEPNSKVMLNTWDTRWDIRNHHLQSRQHSITGIKTRENKLKPSVITLVQTGQVAAINM